ncbi:MAG: LLM class flavin-dependent oxidoreductase [Acidimicrobiia bacterium]|nr:LLM class flavin-dependent oxidoreductase [Acidimicrobiia bacterium]NNF69738.1 LLM class flavin-dependent oxidoreductase [Acidimicrobiia bacterium]NNK91874.1 LLM class flavin-dependent oxidoreductase [Acidimicrobiia bacterium]
MKYAVDIPNFGHWADPRDVAEFAAGVEEAGWDGISLWDHIYVWKGNEVADPWVTMAAIAAATERLRLMMLVTPLPRRRPWVVARQAVSIDMLSEGRFTFGVGIGYPPGPEMAVFGDETNAVKRGDMLDEALDIITGLWSGEEFKYSGDHYKIKKVQFRPTSVQQPRIPIWVAGMWPNRKPFRRAARYDGLAPIAVDADGQIVATTPALIREMLDYVLEHRETDDPFDVTAIGDFPENPDEYEAAGVTWYRVGADPAGGEGSVERWIDAVLEGPPRT